MNDSEPWVVNLVANESVSMYFENGRFPCHLIDAILNVHNVWVIILVHRQGVKRESDYIFRALFEHNVNNALIVWLEQGQESVLDLIMFFHEHNAPYLLQIILHVVQL